jgi:RNA polymerase sigma-70 factor, ECF subfamily
VFGVGKTSILQREGPAPLVDLRLVYDRNAEFLWKSLYRLGVAEVDLPDVMQEVLLVLHRKLDRYDGSCRITSFLFGICLRVAATSRRTKQRRREDLVDANQYLADWTSTDNPERALAEAEMRGKLDEALDELTPEKRAVFVMYELEEIPCADIARLLDIPKGTVHSRLNSARAEFKAAFEQIETRDQAMVVALGERR